MTLKSSLISIFLVFFFFITTSARAEYYNELQCHTTPIGGYEGQAIVKLGMTKTQAFRMTGCPVRSYKKRMITEKWSEWGYRRVDTTAFHEKFLIRNDKWVGNKAKIFKFRDNKLYEIYDYGTSVRRPQLPKTRYKEGPLELEQDKQNAKRPWGRR